MRFAGILFGSSAITLLAAAGFGIYTVAASLLKRKLDDTRDLLLLLRVHEVHNNPHLEGICFDDIQRAVAALKNRTERHGKNELTKEELLSAEGKRAFKYAKALGEARVEAWKLAKVLSTVAMWLTVIGGALQYLNL